VLSPVLNQVLFRVLAIPVPLLARFPVTPQAFPPMLLRAAPELYPKLVSWGTGPSATEHEFLTERSSQVIH
jgi:hypothetical protein